MSGYLIYHPPRTVSQLEDLVIYHDSTSGNQDPYIWNTCFLHTYCHITQMSPRIGDINFWVSGDTFPNFSHLYCDLVFFVAEKIYWANANIITEDDPIIETCEAFNDHYRWARYQHPLKKRRRFTLKADPERSFQPQNVDRQLIDIVPYLNTLGISINDLRQGLRAGFSSKPYRLLYAKSLYNYLDQHAAIKLAGTTLEAIRHQNRHLASL